MTTFTLYDEVALKRVDRLLTVFPSTHFFLFYNNEATPPPIDNWRVVMRCSRFVPVGTFLVVTQDDFQRELDNLKALT